MSEPGDALERDADHAAEAVMHGGTPTLLRAARSGSEASTPTHETAAAIEEVLRTPGSPLHPTERRFMEPRFGRDFERVRIHADPRSADSARAIGALAYTVGHHVVFGAGQYAPETDRGRRLLAHELAHVAQAPGHDKAARTVFRTVASWSNCPGGVNDAPDDSTRALAGIDARAGEIAQNASALTAERPVSAETLQAFEDHFGLPSAAPGGFLNRLTGAVRPDQQTALNEELHILSRRYAMVARLLSQPIQYVCAGDPESVARAHVPDCDAFAWSFRGRGRLILCPRFWTDAADDDQRAAVVLHEAVHIIWGRNSPPERGEVRDATAPGPGGAYVNGHCYDEFAARLMGTTTPRVRCQPPAS